MPRTNGNEVTTLIARAATAALSPLGCQRFGRSRLWVSDHRFWLINIEFQPSSWGNGSYLNVGAMWLWRPAKGHAFDAGYRTADFINFDNSDQFSAAVTGLAATAAKETLRLRSEFRSLSQIYTYLRRTTHETNWRIFHAAIAAGLLGDVQESRYLFGRFDETPGLVWDWGQELRAKIGTLASQLDEPERFRSSVLAMIQKTRSRLKLSSDAQCLDSIA